jgi:FkbM family methyltransferase
MSLAMPSQQPPVAPLAEEPGVPANNLKRAANDDEGATADEAASKRQKVTTTFQTRPLKSLSLDDVPGNIPKSVKRDYFPGAKFWIRDTVVGQDTKGSHHGDQFILKKMFSERPYETARRKATKGVVSAASVGQPLPVGVVSSAPSSSNVFRAWLSGRTVLDLGANIGAFAVQAAWSGGRVVAFEPESETYAVLCRNAEENGKKGNYKVAKDRTKEMIALDNLSEQLADQTADSGALVCVRGAVSNKESADDVLFLYPKITKSQEKKMKDAEKSSFSASSTKEESSLYRPNKPNRSSLLKGDGVNTDCVPELVEKVEHVWTLTEALHKVNSCGSEAASGGWAPVSVIKMDIEGSELDLFRNVNREDLVQAVTPEVCDHFELLVYFHLDKWPQLRLLHEFLLKLESLFSLVHAQWTPMAPRPDFKVRESAGKTAKKRPSAGIAAKKRPAADGAGKAAKKELPLPWSNWREVVSNPENPATRGGYDPELEGRKDIGFAASKKDILIFCRGVKQAAA